MSTKRKRISANQFDPEANPAAPASAPAPSTFGAITHFIAGVGFEAIDSRFSIPLDDPSNPQHSLKIPTAPTKKILSAKKKHQKPVLTSAIA